jgi:cbb3-type cytochrome oxidase subunit 1
MKTIYISLSFFAILLVFLAIMYIVDIPAPIKDVVETFNLELK